MRSNSSFLFSLRNKDNLAPFIASTKQGQEQYAIYSHPSYGPSFGGGTDLRIFDNPQVNHHTAGLVTLINFLLVMFITVNNQRTFLLGSISSKQQKLKSSIEHLVRLSNLVTNQSD